MEYLTFLKITHLLGMIAGFGGALYADYLIVTQGIFKPLRASTLRQVEQLSSFVLLGLMVLWLSGVFLTLHIVNVTPEFLTNEKFWAKVSIVGVLTLNGVVVHSFVLGQAKKNLGRRLLFDTDKSVSVAMILSGAVSFMSWTVPFVLGKAPEFSYVVPYLSIMAVWLFLIMFFATALVALLTCARSAWFRGALANLGWLGAADGGATAGGR